MINIEINGDKVVITEHSKFTDLSACDAYFNEENGRIAVVVCRPSVEFDDMDKSCLYVAGIIVCSQHGDIEAVTDKIVYEGLVWDNSLYDYRGVYIENGNFEELNSKTGVKVFFGRC